MNCAHCGAPVTLERNREIAFCCLGCKTAYKLIHSLSLNKYYEFCSEIYKTRPDKVENFKNDINYIEFVETKDMENSIELIVDGIKCNSCVWLLESSLKQQDGVLKASINITTKVLSIFWLGEKEKIKDLITLIESLGYKAVPLVDSATVNDSGSKQLLKMVALSGVIWVQNMMIGMGIWAGDITGEIGHYTRIFMNLCDMLLTVPVLLYTSRTFFSTAIAAIRNRQSHMDIPISLAIIITLVISIYGTVVGNKFVFYEAASSLVFALLTGRYLQANLQKKVNEHARSLILMKPHFVTLDRESNLELVSIKSVKAGDILHIASGERIPLDGEIVGGTSEIDNSIITGESNPQSVEIGSRIFAGAINLTNPIKIRVESDDENSVISEIKRLIDNATSQKSQYKTLASKVAKAYTPVVLLLSTLTAIVWSFYGSVQEAILNGVSVLVITCPCAMGLAIPIVHTVATSRLMKEGIFIKSQDALERLSEVESVALDKTGILTYGKPQLLTEIPNEYKPLIKGLAIHSKHHLCMALVDALNTTYHSELADVYEEKGLGVRGIYGDKVLMLGRASWCGVDVHKEVDVLSTFFVMKNADGTKLKSIKLDFRDKIREEAYDFISSLKKLFNGRIFIISGDTNINVESVGKQLGIDEYYGELTPQQKHEIITNRTKCFMIGDGLNDAAAMSSAHCSMSPSNIVELSQNQSSIVFQNTLMDIITTIKAARMTNRLCKQNIGMSIIYNILSIPIAVFGYATPLISAIFMSLSSLSVILNTIVKRWK